jgi:hypothetical protein
MVVESSADGEDAKPVEVRSVVPLMETVFAEG